MTRPLVAHYDHTGFVTRDIEASVAFWTEALGLDATNTVERGSPWVAEMTGVLGARLRIAHLTGPGIHLEFICFVIPDGGTTPREPTALATGHVCLKVPDPAVAQARMLELGGHQAGRIATITEGAIAGRRGVYPRDPGGVLVELLEDPLLAGSQAD